MLNRLKRLIVGLLCLLGCEKNPSNDQDGAIFKEEFATPCFFKLSTNAIKSGESLSVQLAPAYLWSNIEKIKINGQNITSTNPLLEIQEMSSGKIEGKAYFKGGQTKICHQSLLVKAATLDAYCTMSYSHSGFSKNSHEITVSLSVGGSEANQTISSSIDHFDLESAQGGQYKFDIDEPMIILGKIDLPDDQSASCQVKVSRNDISYCQAEVAYTDRLNLEQLDAPRKKEYEIRVQNLFAEYLKDSRQALDNPMQKTISNISLGICETSALAGMACQEYDENKKNEYDRFGKGVVNLDGVMYDYFIASSEIKYKFFKNAGQNEVLVYYDQLERIGVFPVELCKCREVERFSLKDTADPFNHQDQVTFLPKESGSGGLKLLGDQIHPIKLEHHSIEAIIVEPRKGETRPACVDDWGVQT